VAGRPPCDQAFLAFNLVEPQFEGVQFTLK
jgi:hypothetical protein